ncbi:MAG: DUF3137 domain-containing protein [Roseburia sp.]|nr:DUF3137 domain-containing protein [Anaeroplasma bactoclasticum]MCM1197113.1 DUF3137 domain-containing protein [Roseburia sp.]MCM1556702.1 DUF3137 domain-containing protein [Anaeroplasma bactoclasticum]
MSKIEKRRQMFIIAECIIGICLFIFLIIGFINMHLLLIFFLFFFLVLWIFGSFVLYHFYIKMPYKSLVVQPTLEGIRKGIKYSYVVSNKEDYIEMFKKYNLIPLARNYDLNDEIKDLVYDTNYTSFDLIASHQVNTGKSTHECIDFKGKVYDIELGKTYCDYILKEDGKKIKPEGFTKIDLESIEMNDKFDLYTRSTVEIYKIFTPKFIQKCNKINFFENKNSIICHIGTHFYIFLANKENQFESLAAPPELIKLEYQRQYETLEKYLTPFL